MRSVAAIAGPTVLVAIVIGGLGCASSATASGDGNALNGTYLATSNGEWARTNDRYQGEASVRSTWTITSTCTTPFDCTGRVTSDAGWSADLHRQNSEWTVKRDIPNWERCVDGTAFTGAQEYRFYPADASGVISLSPRGEGAGRKPGRPENSPQFPGDAAYIGGIDGPLANGGACEEVGTQRCAHGGCGRACAGCPSRVAWQLQTQHRGQVRLPHLAVGYESMRHLA